MSLSDGAAAAAGVGLRSGHWPLSYKTSSTLVDGRPVDMLHDFYLPALRLAVRYDRVAGYFRSSSLAAASAGFSTFVGRQGRMRLIVGADLDPGDVRAVLAGDHDRLAARLNGLLEAPESWPEGVRNGVVLLAWMVARGYLEVRVAFRVHGKTGAPLSFGAVDDGYVHEKWFVLYDESGNRLYGAGTLNESRTALILNAENIDIHCDWWGETERRRVDEASRDFENLWLNRVRHMPVMTLPEAVRQRLIRMAEGIDRPVEINGVCAAPKVVEPPAAIERLRFAIIRDAPKMPGGRFVGLETAPVAPWPHQEVVVRRLVETWPHSHLLCDEVGLGKTIEAGLAFRSLYLSGLVKRILIAAPASLTQQWQRQMASKVLLSFGRVRTTPDLAHEYVFPAGENRPADSIYWPDLTIISTGLLARPERVVALDEAEPFDIALVDEAHNLRRRNPSSGTEGHPDFGRLYLSVRDHLRKKTSSLWLATATPMQINPVEVCDLLVLTDRVGAFQYDPTLALQYYEVLGKVVRGQASGEQEWEFLRRAVRAVRMQDPMLWRFVEEGVVDGRIRMAVQQWLEYGRIPWGRDRELVCRLIFSVSPLSRVMLRHTRQLLEIYRDHGHLEQNLPRRHVDPLPRIVFTPLERRVYDQLEGYCQGLARRIGTRTDHQAGRQAVGFLLSFLRLRFASGLYAFHQTLQRRLRKVEATLRHQLVQEADSPGWQTDESGAEGSTLRDLVFEDEFEDDTAAVESVLKNRRPDDLEWEQSRLQAMLDDMADLTGPSSKMQVLFQRLDQRRDRQTGRIRQAVIFTRFYDTLNDIVTRLRQEAGPQLLIGTYSGQGAEYFDPGTGRMLAVDREEVKERFLRGEIDLLVCTDAAAEGLNLQTADLLVNFDLGWNPMKIEQRIGRIDRIGQKHKVISVLNLCYADSAEEIVYGRLLSRLDEANLIVGTQQLSLLPVEADDFQQLAEGSLTPEELYVRAQERLERQRQQTETFELRPQELYEIYTRLARAPDRTRAPIDLDAIWKTLCESRYLRDRGCMVLNEGAQPALILSGIEGVPDGVVLTTSRELYEEGLAGEGRRVHFAAYGDPFFGALLEHLGRFDLPPGVRPITVPVSGIEGVEGVEVIGYAVAGRGAGGTRTVRLIRAWHDLDGLEEQFGAHPECWADSLTEAELAPLRAQLAQLVREEFEPCRAAKQIERENIDAARAQEMLNFLVARSLLEARAPFSVSGVHAPFWSILREVETLFEDRAISVVDLPADFFRWAAEKLLFDCLVPSVGDKAQISVPPLLGRTAIEAAKRVADAMKVRRSELLVNAVVARLRRKAEAGWRQLQ